MEEKKVIRLRKGEPLSCSCPYCHSESVRRIRRNCSQKIEEIIDSDYSGTKITDYEVDDFASWTTQVMLKSSQMRARFFCLTLNILLMMNVRKRLLNFENL